MTQQTELETMPINNTNKKQIAITFIITILSPILYWALFITLRNLSPDYDGGLAMGCGLSTLVTLVAGVMYIIYMINPEAYD
jgi:hypothetical protein